MLEIKDLIVSYGTVRAVNGVSLRVSREIVCLCGRNGAGKSSLLKAIVGIVQKQSGEILLDGKEITNIPLHQRLKLGIGYVPEDRKLFNEMTVKENIEVARIGARVSLKKEIDVCKLIPEIETILDRKSKQLSGGQQKLVSIARAIVTSPKVLLFDEILEGLARSLSIKISDILQNIKQEGKDILCAESSLENAELYADRVIWLERGKIVAEGTPQEIKIKMKELIKR